MTDEAPVVIAIAIGKPELADRLSALLADVPGVRLATPGEPADAALVIPDEPEPGPDVALTPRELDVLAIKGRIARGYLGLSLQPVKLDAGGIGAMATSVDPKGPGAAAGVRQGDIIVAWDGAPIRGVHQLVRALGPDSVGASVKLTLSRGGEPIETTLTIGERPESQ